MFSIWVYALSGTFTGITLITFYLTFLHFYAYHFSWIFKCRVRSSIFISATANKTCNYNIMSFKNPSSQKDKAQTKIIVSKTIIMLVKKKKRKITRRRRQVRYKWPGALDAPLLRCLVWHPLGDALRCDRFSHEYTPRRRSYRCCAQWLACHSQRVRRCVIISVSLMGAAAEGAVVTEPTYVRYTVHKTAPRPVRPSLSPAPPQLSAAAKYCFAGFTEAPVYRPTPRALQVVRRLMKIDQRSSFVEMFLVWRPADSCSK